MKGTPKPSTRKMGSSSQSNSSQLSQGLVVLMIFMVYILGHTLWTSNRFHNDLLIPRIDLDPRLDSGFITTLRNPKSDNNAKLQTSVQNQADRQASDSNTQTLEADPNLTSNTQSQDSTVGEVVEQQTDNVSGDMLQQTTTTETQQEQQQFGDNDLPLTASSTEDTTTQTADEAAAALAAALNLSNVPEMDVSKCKILVLDPSTAFAEQVGVPTCDIDQIWPYREVDEDDEDAEIKPGEMEIPHWAARDATGFWVAQAIRSGDHFTRHMQLADLIFVNTHCYTSWYHKAWLQTNSTGLRGPVNEISHWISRLFADGVFLMPQYMRTRGRRLAITRPWLAAPPGAMLDSCATLRHTFTLAGERGAFCENDRNKATLGDALLLPPVVMQPYDLNATASGTIRKTFLHYHSIKCPSTDATSETQAAGTAAADGLGGEDPSLGLEGFDGRWEAADTLLSTVEMQLKQLGKEALTTCGDVERGGWQVQEEVMDLMKDSRFCVVVPGHTSQAGGLLTEVVLSGCLPVFLGPPFHALPMARDVNYTDFAIFFNMTTLSIEAADPLTIPDWTPPSELDPTIPPESVVQITDIPAVVQYLKSIPVQQLTSIQAALDANRIMFYYAPFPGFHSSTLAKTIVKRMCEHSLRQKLASRESYLKRMSELAKENQVKANDSTLTDGDDEGENGGFSMRVKTTDIEQEQGSGSSDGGSGGEQQQQQQQENALEDGVIGAELDTTTSQISDIQ